MTDDVNTSANAGGTGNGGTAGGTGPASGPVSGTPRFGRPLLPRVKRASVVSFVNETLDAVEELADKLAGAIGLRSAGTTDLTPPAPPTPPSPPEPPFAAPPPPPL